MPGGRRHGQQEEAVRRQAADWFARLRSPEGIRDRAAFEEWRAADPANAAAFDRLEMRWDQSAFLAHTELGRARRLEKSRPPPARWRPAAAAAAAAALLILAVPLLRSGAPADETRPFLARMSYSTSVGEVRRHRLPDGSLMTVDTDSSVRIAFGKDRREAFVARGRARFEVVPDRQRPFEVEAGDARVIAHGTIFDVSLSAAGVTEVSLLEGSVAVRLRGAAPQTKNSSAAVLAAGQQVSVAPGRAPAPPAQAPPGRALWVSGMLSFDGLGLGAAIEEINRYASRKIRLSSPSLTGLRVTGAFRASQTEEFARAVAAAFRLHVRETDDAILIEPGHPSTG